MARIQPANETNVAEIVSVVNDAFQVESDFRAGDRTSADEVAQLMNEGQFLIATRDQQVAGAVFVRVNGSTGHFAMLAVRPSLQRLGLGHALIEAAEGYCRSLGCTRMTLTTGSVRRELLERYSKQGYTITSVEPVSPDGPFRKPIEMVSMAKEI
jgi:GNAT superfamily N-acetyltransferase